jgi:hypothetical protein
MKRLSEFRWVFFFVLMFLVTGTFQVCSAAGRDPFTLTAKNVDKNKGPSDSAYIDDGYAWGFGDLGFMLNGHGLPDRGRTFVITHQSAEGKTELIWPVFDYGNDQANAVVLDHTLVFMALLPNGRPVLMAHRVGEPPMVISEAVLRLAAKRLGTTVIMPGTNYCFIKVRLPPDRVWLKGLPLSATQSYPPLGAFALELTSEDLRRVIDETRHRGKLFKANKFDYLAEEGVPLHISTQDAEEIGAIETPSHALQTAPAIHRTTSYTPRVERLHGNILLDVSNHYAYFSTYHEPGRILKVALGNDSQSPSTVVGAAVLEGEEDKPFHSVIDPQRGYAYFGTTFPGHLVKVALGSSNTPPYRVGSVLIEENWNVGAGVLDPASGYGCFQVGKRLVKIKLGKGDEPPVIISQTEFPKEAGVISFDSAVLDPTTRYAYFGTDLTQVYKIAFGEGDAPPKFVGSVKLQDDEFGLRGALIDPQNGFAWFTSQNGSLIKIALGEKDDPPRRIGALKVASPYQYLMNTFGLDKAGYAYLGTMGGGKTGDPECCAGGVLKIVMGKGDELPRTVSFMPLPDGVHIEEGIVDSENRMLYLGVTAAGKGCKVLKLSLGEADAPPKILEATNLYPK